ncbi:hypothetical protein EVG20_g6353 [Dentipellis fragilis]|uniref:Pentacotripeptide-repeat region of PRORP domain-containing protein n=1 Tax=Dentipellis fragilis TaxID=205917 RepID=A0A4Y9YNW7_9AGAM|nr:hypothetical protein EVG20_g6353 [Dentipellis fragilis]
MRVKIQASPPLPEIKAWFSLSNLSPSSSVALLKHELCKTLSTLRESGVHGRDLILLLDDFELLGETSIDIIKDGDMICLQMRTVLPKRKAAREASPSRKKVRLYEQGAGHQPIARLVKATSSGRKTLPPVLPSKRLSPGSSSSSDTSSEETSTSEESSSDSSSESSTSSSSSTDSDSDSALHLAALRKPVRTVPKPAAVQVTSVQHIPPGFGKPQTQSRNLRRRKKRQYEREAPPAVLSSKASAVNATPLGEAGTSRVATLHSAAGVDEAAEPAIAMMALSNKNKRKGFKTRHGWPDSSANIVVPPLAFAASSVPSPTKQPRLVPPSEKQENGTLPPNIFVTSVDVEAGLWRSKRGKGKRKADADFYYDDSAQPHESRGFTSTQREQDADIELPYDEVDPHTEEVPDWDGIDTRWESFTKVTETASLVPGTLVGWKELGIHPVTLTPEKVLSLARITSIDGTEVKVRLLVRPGANAMVFGGLQDAGGEVEGEEETFGTSDVLDMDWRVPRLDAQDVVARQTVLSSAHLSVPQGLPSFSTPTRDDPFLYPTSPNHLLHHTARAAAAAQTQAGQTLRNVLGLQSSGSQSANGLTSWNAAGSSSWGSGHAGAGGAKYHTGSRFYSGYTGPGRAITQANASTADPEAAETDEDEPTPKFKSTSSAKKSRVRSHSLSVGSHGRPDPRENVGVLEAIKLYARSRHAFAGSHLLEAAQPSSEVAANGNPPRLTRRNSTSSTDSISASGDHIPDISPAPVTLAFGSVDPAAPQSTSPPNLASSHGPSTSLFNELRLARDKADPSLVRVALNKLQSIDQQATVSDWNMAMDALVAIRAPGEPVTEILNVYNNMVKLSIFPNTETYSLLIQLLTDREHEVHSAVSLLQRRIERRKQLGVTNSPESFADEQRIAGLQAENNFASALSLFYAASALPQSRRLPYHSYSSLLRVCSLNGNLDAAIRIFADIEKRIGDKGMPASIYGNLLAVYSSISDIEGAKVVFNEFRRVCAASKIAWADDKLDMARRGHIITWDRMIEAYFQNGDAASALELLEQMLDTPNGTNFGVKDIPCPAQSTYTQIIMGFLRIGDTTSAISWLERLVEQGHAVETIWTPTVVPPRPHRELFVSVLNKLAFPDTVHQLNRVYKLMSQVYHDTYGRPMHWKLRSMVYEVNVKHLQNNSVDSQEALATLEFLTGQVLGPREFWDANLREFGGYPEIATLVDLYAKYGAPHQAVQLIEGTPKRSRAIEPSQSVDFITLAEISGLVETLSSALLFDNGVARVIPLPVLLRLMSYWQKHSVPLSASFADAVTRAYDAEKLEHGLPSELSSEEWTEVAVATSLHGQLLQLPVSEVVQRNQGFLSDLAQVQFNLADLPALVSESLLRPILEKEGFDATKRFLGELGPSFEALLSATTDTTVVDASLDASADAPTTARFEIDTYQSRFVDDYTNYPDPSAALEAFSRFQSGAQLGLYPNPEVIARLMDALGRVKEMEKVFVLYDASQNVLGCLEHDKEAQAYSWAKIENAMLLAYAHNGDGVHADMHRIRLLESGATPNSDAYGALIQSVKETTDDTSRAMAYFEESQMRGVKANIYVYNTIISKLAKARKADLAIDFFRRMKTDGIMPTSVTYGALIAACCRVGDAQSAETLFEEMASQPNFKPRVPPYNTMMQFYVQTKPNRPRFLHYFQAMKKANIRPTAHTYKLLIDAYGTIEPVQFKNVEETFAQLVGDKSVTVQGSHWAAMINAYGCVAKNLEKAASIFDSIATHATTLSNSRPLPDAITYEAMINVLVTLRRTDLIPHYIERLQKSGIHMTAYIANLLIRGHAASGDIEKARAVFENLSDPPVGVAAPNNHAPHDGSVESRSVSPDDPIFREPSTWEAMVRAELGNGNRNEALALLDRVLARQYPESIYNRISGIMLDDAVSPWPSESASSGASSP